MIFEKKVLNDSLNSEQEWNKYLHLVDEYEDGMHIDLFSVFKEGARKVVVFLPSAQPVSSDPVNPVFHRWSWERGIRGAHVLSFSDPVLYEANIHASWFFSDSCDDVIKRMEYSLRKILKVFNLNDDDVLFYGSSMGGFGALMLSSLFDGAMAIAEVPQLNMINYPYVSAKKAVSDKVLSGQDFDQFCRIYPEKSSVIERFKSNNYIPPFKLITNSKDEGSREHIEFLGELYDAKDCFKRWGDYSLCFLSEDIGHKPLQTVQGVSIINEVLGSGWKVHQVVEEYETIDELDYKAILNKAVALASEVKYIRTEEDSNKYSEAKELLYKASDVNSQADWPYLKICSMVKLWTNSFNNEIMTAAIEAFSRRQTLESFIYCCRGFLYNLELDVATKKVQELMERVEDDQVKNVGQIFLSIIAYELKDYSGYGRHISSFLNNKADEFDPYIAIPVSTVYRNSVFSSQYYDSINPSVAGQLVVTSDFSLNKGECYIVSTSCDEKYFYKYAEYIIKSFSKMCDGEGVLHLSIVDGDVDKINKTLSSWGAKNVYVSVQNLTVGDNIGPIASLLRFSHISCFLENYHVPVLVLDLDSVIREPLSLFVNSHSSVDLCSRVLGSGVAPWEKYTGGFALFNPTDKGKMVARNIAYSAESLSDSNHKQWWIDQNCFEAGIRSVFVTGDELALIDVSKIRDRYCVMPVGPDEAKLHVLKNALSTIVYE